MVIKNCTFMFVRILKSLFYTRHDIAEILLKLALNSNQSINQSFIIIYCLVSKSDAKT